MAKKLYDFNCQYAKTDIGKAVYCGKYCKFVAKGIECKKYKRKK